MGNDPVVLGDRYELGAVIGRGGMAEVRRARDTRLGRDVAIKLLRADLAGDPMFQARFRREAQSAAGLNHPTIVSVYDTGIQTDADSDVEIPYIVMELVEGHTLREVLRDGRRILPERALELAAGVLDALGYSHKAGIIHRDIKPANVMLTKSGGVKVMDFGIARAVSDTAASMTQTAAVIGTAQYLSPEQARGETVDGRSDIYSAGCLLYELLTGRPPFQGDSPVSVAYQHVRETPVAPSQLEEGDALITPAMDAIVLKSLAKDPADRYQTAAEMREDINRVLAGQDATAVIPAAFSEPTRVLPASQATPATAVFPGAVGAAAVAAGSALEDTATQLVPGMTETTTTATLPAATDKRGTNPFVAALVTFLAIALVGTFGWFGYQWVNGKKSTPPPQVAVPSVVKFNQDQAKSLLGDAGLEAVVKTVNGPADTKGLVIDQDPAGKTMVDPGSKVTITVNLGPETVTIPKGLVGKDQASVLAQLTALGLTPTAADAKTEPATAKAGEVVALEPGEGAAVPKGGAVTVQVATGMVTMPPLAHKTRDEAIAQLTGLGFSADQITLVEEYATTDFPAGQVISQNPVAATKVARTTAITLVVSKGVAPTTSAPPPPPTTAPSTDPTTQKPTPSATPSR